MFERLQAKSGEELTVRLFGAVGQWETINAGAIARLLDEAKADGFRRVKLLLHCPGGSIFEGVAVNSMMRSSGLEIAIEVHGIACSWGAVMVQSAHHRAMVEGTRLMIHQGHGGVQGSADRIITYGNLLATLNDDIATLLAERTGKAKAWVLKHWMAEGKDRWFTAREALDAGLIDEIIPRKTPPPQAAAVDELAAWYDETLLTTNTNTMTKKQLKLLGLDENATEAQAEAALQTLLEKQHQATGGETTAGGDKAAALVMKMAAATEGFLTGETTESFARLAALDPEAAYDLIPKKSAAPESRAGIADLIRDIKAAGGSEKKPAKKFSEMDEAALKALEASDPQALEALFRAEFGQINNPQH